MAFTLPLGIRVAAGLLGTAIDRASKLPAELPSLAVTFVGQALRTSMRVQQEVAELATRGDELLAPLTGRPQESPEWATFDEDEEEPTAAAPPPPADPGGDSFGGVHEPAVILLDGTPIVDAPILVTTGPGETIPTAAGFVVGPAAPIEALTGGTPAEVIVADIPVADIPVADIPGEPTANPVANARRTTAQTRSRTAARTRIKSDHRLTIAELKERTQQMTVAEVKVLLAQEEAGPNRAAYLTLLGNRLMTLQHEDR